MSAARRARRMRDNQVAPGHNFGGKLEEFIRDNPPTPGKLTELLVFHDRWCPSIKGGLCRCDPDIKRVPVPLVPTDSLAN